MKDLRESILDNEVTTIDRLKIESIIIAIREIFSLYLENKYKLSFSSDKLVLYSIKTVKVGSFDNEAVISSCNNLSSILKDIEKSIKAISKTYNFTFKYKTHSSRQSEYKCYDREYIIIDNTSQQSIKISISYHTIQNDDYLIDSTISVPAAYSRILPFE